MKAVVMAGGLGTRLRPLTKAYPKPMTPFIDKPVLGHILALLKRHHISDVIITVQYLADQIQAHFGDGSSLGMRIHYVIESEPLGTAGGVKQAQPFLDDDTFMVISGDLITDVNLQPVLQFHQDKDAMATLVLKQVDDPLDYGTVITDETGRIRDYVEKPTPEQVISKTVNTGIYILEPDILNCMEPDQIYDFSEDIIPQLLQQQVPLYGYVVEGYWCDMGTIDDYVNATADALNGKLGQIDLGRHLDGETWAGGPVEIGAGVTFEGPIYLGPQVKINRKVTILGPTVVYGNTIIEADVQIERSIICSNCSIGEAARIQNALICQNCCVAAGSAVVDTLLSGVANCD